MQAIVTRYLGPTNYKGSRVKAMCEARPRGVVVGWDYGASNGTALSESEANHDRAARALIESMGWFGTWARGALPSGGFCYVCIKRECLNGYRKPHPQAASALDVLYVLEGGAL
jgi:hypothetical protein